jgi:hypothetical protein
MSEVRERNERNRQIQIGSAGSRERFTNVGATTVNAKKVPHKGVDNFVQNRQPVSAIEQTRHHF